MEGKKTQKRLQTNTALRQIISDFYAEGHKAKAEGRPVIWIPPMNGMIELFYAMGITPVFPETGRLSAPPSAPTERISNMRPNGDFRAISAGISETTWATRSTESMRRTSR